MASKQTPLQKAYRRERNRIQRAIREVKKYGFEPGIKPPDIPKKITQASVRRLQNISTKKIYESATGARPGTGDKINFREFRIVWRRASEDVKKEYNDILRSINFRYEISDLIKQQREAFDASYKHTENEHPKSPIIPTTTETLEGWKVGYDNFMSIVESYSDRAYSLVKERISVLKQQYGEQAIGEMFIEAVEGGVIIDPSESYNIGLVFRMLNSFARLLMMNEEDTNKFTQYVANDSYNEEDYF